jgi:hypothetical protein
VKAASFPTTLPKIGRSPPSSTRRHGAPREVFFFFGEKHFFKEIVSCLKRQLYSQSGTFIAIGSRQYADGFTSQ